MGTRPNGKGQESGGNPQIFKRLGFVFALPTSVHPTSIHIFNLVVIYLSIFLMIPFQYIVPIYVGDGYLFIYYLNTTAT